MRTIPHTHTHTHTHTVVISGDILRRSVADHTHAVSEHRRKRFAWINLHITTTALRRYGSGSALSGCIHSNTRSHFSAFAKKPSHAPHIIRRCMTGWPISLRRSHLRTETSVLSTFVVLYEINLKNGLCYYGWGGGPFRFCWYLGKHAKIRLQTGIRK